VAGVEELVLRVYAGLLRLYPAQFQREFGEEMQSVFAEALDASRAGGPGARLRLLGRELRDLPGSLLHEWRDREGDMQTSANEPMRSGDSTWSAGKGTSTPGWDQAFLGALPFVMILILEGLPKLLVWAGVFGLQSVGAQVLNIVLAALGGGTLLLMLGLAWRRRWPLWSASWYPVFWMLPVLLLPWLLSSVLPGRVSSTMSEIELYLVIPLSIAGLLYWVTRLDRLRGSLAALPVLYLLWFPNMEQTPRHIIPLHIEMLIKAASIALISITIMLIVRNGDWRTGLWSILATTLAVGLQFSYAGIYYGGTLPFTAPGPNAIEVLRSFIPQYLVAGAIILGPQLAWMFRETGRRSGVSGKVGYHLALLGLLVIMAANLAGLMSGTNDYPAGYKWLTYTVLGRSIYAALGAYILGLAMLYWGARRSGVLPDLAELILLAILPVALPLTFALPFITWTRPVSQVYGVPVLWDFPQSLILAAGLVWLALAAWLVTRRPTAPPPTVAVPQMG
jgi:hypothetical protein